MRIWSSERRLAVTTLAALAALIVLPRPAAAFVSRRTCYCDLRQGRLMFSPLLMDVPDPVLKDFLVSCRRAETWCPSACRRAARKTLLNGGDGDVSPLRGAAGEAACTAVGHATPAENPVHVFATYRVSNCRSSGSHYFGRLCCRQDADGIVTFNELCTCEPAPSEEMAGLVSAATEKAEAAATESAEAVDPAATEHGGPNTTESSSSQAVPSPAAEKAGEMASPPSVE
ncbi:uncharacterized protein LOC122375117 [Amphibalanus amphitrite]|uniref:uncharacterized protein LOC122375117 n=1 Tax=Amphibalanus amphitrite TaxID=1232801 RepID=UPI001C8FFE2B|nr:uncharacterized protein LOC122375117 [Amphibalanus amphitrite]